MAQNAAALAAMRAMRAEREPRIRGDAHDWKVAPRWHSTLDLVCACGAEQHDVTPAAMRQTVRYRGEPNAPLSETVRGCTLKQARRANLAGQTAALSVSAMPEHGKHV